MSRYTADCSRCCGLCCIVPTYLREQGFPFDKPADKPCRHLDHGGSCLVHAERGERGFGACIGFDCHGAGQWITQQLFGGARWNASLGPEMARAYAYWLPRFEAAALLEAALPLVRADTRPLLRRCIASLLEPGTEGEPAG